MTKTDSNGLEHKMSAATKSTTDNLIAAIKHHAEEAGLAGDDFTALAQSLNRAGILTSRQRPWTAQNLRIFNERHGDFLKLQSGTNWSTSSPPPEKAPELISNDLENNQQGDEITESAFEQAVTNDLPGVTNETVINAVPEDEGPTIKGETASLSSVDTTGSEISSQEQSSDSASEQISNDLANNEQGGIAGPNSVKQETSEQGLAPGECSLSNELPEDGEPLSVPEKDPSSVSGDSPTSSKDQSGASALDNAEDLISNELVTSKQHPGLNLLTDSQSISNTLPEPDTKLVTNQLPANAKAGNGEDITNDLASPTKTDSTLSADDLSNRLPEHGESQAGELVSNELPVSEEQQVISESSNQESGLKESDSQSTANLSLTRIETLLIKQLVTDYQGGTLADILDWWRQNQGGYRTSLENRPTFKGKRRNTGLHVNEKILELAAAKVKTDKPWSGGSLSQLVERLLWTYVGSPEELLDNPEKLSIAPK
jgi:hypothetical protein